jgi:DNA-binding MarR family transcriptional regulator
VTTTAELATRSWHGLRTVVLERHDRRREVCDALGMSFIRIKALRRASAGALTMRALAEALAIDAPYTTLIVDDLERQGLLLRAPHPQDRRAKLVSITEAGVEMAQRADEILGRPPGALLSLSQQELVLLDEIVARLLD